MFPISFLVSLQNKIKKITSFNLDKKSEAEKKEESRSLSIKEGFIANLSDGFGNKYISPFIIALGGNNFIIGLLTSLPALIGNISQVFSIRLMERYARKRIVVFFVILQAIMWLLIALMSIFYFLYKIDSLVVPTIVLVLYTILVTFGTVLSPIWSSWFRDILPDRPGSYVGKRTMYVGLAGFFGMIIAGFILDFFTASIFFGFAFIFSIAFLSRIISAYLLSKQYEPEFVYEKKYFFSLFDFFKRMRNNNFGRFTIYASLLLFATSIASPFFTVYMLKDLEFSYFFYTIIILSASLTAILSMPFWGRFIDKYGTVKTAKVAGLLIPFVPLFWLVTPFLQSNFIVLILYLFVIELFSGYIWAGFNLAAGNFIYSAVTRERVALCVAYFSIIRGLGTFIGAILGGFILDSQIVFFGFSTILFLFLLSGVLRMLFVLLMFNRFKEVRPVNEIKMQAAIYEVIHDMPKSFFRIIR